MLIESREDEKSVISHIGLSRIRQAALEATHDIASLSSRATLILFQGEESCQIN